MKLTYRDPYESVQAIVVPDGDEEALREIIDFCNENARLVQNAERRERYHAPWHIEGMEYEGETLAYKLTPEKILLMKEESERVEDALSRLSETQRRRLFMKAEGMTYRQIAEAEGVSLGTAEESVDAARKKFLKFF
jgi:RNA polymerase sigma factor (sigma-70 family)